MHPFDKQAIGILSSYDHCSSSDLLYALRVLAETTRCWVGNLAGKTQLSYCASSAKAVGGQGEMESLCGPRAMSKAKADTPKITVGAIQRAVISPNEEWTRTDGYMYSNHEDVPHGDVSTPMGQGRGTMT